MILSQREEEVTLILAQIESALEQHAPTLGSLQPRKMPCGDEVCAELIGAINEPTELEILIAHHTRIRRATGFVFIREVLDDVLLKFRRLVNEVVGNSQLVTDRARVGDGLRPAAFVLRTIHTILRPEFERDADDVVTLLL